ncbi:hypothetical protein LOB72_09085 [Lactobacillus delbrueckii subsp. lactis]|uniref:hypothetical protein n=1 Tax=Lactobacillus delbrueckii TaxID=1584 RepID=UPI001C352DA0|nr:hypothetical protein [Lactobacillus delbrueckii]MBT8800723.1 hypothetical protein [Lactobacillus delbrueckii subsp. bulgaricus]MBT8843406.1 hypothetical protein [Lactobacillus delbrueckii subsp. bulgaricus]MBT9033579.1 hypothetical protein [Lactobacillus delbrueckii subsp. bulgaricus]MBT9040019.1 hypothetical protein [Lactobacillus delbrueckii subsp. bulgaricus]MCD5448826.1 hypothetical protein [Lactobacillus delbrueckii subsp. lactis]
MTEHPIVPLELPKGRVKPKNRATRNRLVLNLKSNVVELSFYSDATNELMLEVVDRFLNHD